MAKNRKPSWLEKILGPRAGGRLERAASDELRKLKPSELAAAGRSPKSEGYVLKAARRITAKTPIISKRQYQEKRLSEGTGERVTLERRAQQYQSGQRVAKTAEQESMRERSLEAWSLRKKYPGEPIPRIRAHLRNVGIKKQGGWLDEEAWLREKAFAEGHLEVPEAGQAYRTYFNYGHVKRPPAGSTSNPTGRRRVAR